MHLPNTDHQARLSALPLASGDREHLRDAVRHEIAAMLTSPPNLVAISLTPARERKL